MSDFYHYVIHGQVIKVSYIFFLFQKLSLQNAEMKFNFGVTPFQNTPVVSHFWYSSFALLFSHIVTWEPEGRYCCSKSMAITPFWLSTDDISLGARQNNVNARIVLPGTHPSARRIHLKSWHLLQPVINLSFVCLICRNFIPSKIVFKYPAI